MRNRTNKPCIKEAAGKSACKGGLCKGVIRLIAGYLPGSVIMGTQTM